MASKAKASWDPLPSPFYEFFCYVEPLLTFAGAIGAIFMPKLFSADLAPRYSASDPTAVAAVRLLGNCFLLIGCVSFFILPRMAAFKQHNADATHDLLCAFFTVLAVADVTHIACATVDLGHDLRQYNMLAHGNTTLVWGLFAWRMAWFRTTWKARRRRD